jgi:PAS domain S-box-containing protein
MAEQRALTERIIQNAPAGIAFLDGDLVYRRLNDAYAYLMGMSVEQVLDKSIYEVFPGATDQFEPLMRRVMETGEPYVTTSFPFRFMLDGEEKITYWDFTYQPVLDSQGRVGILILEVEVSDRMERERLHHEQMAHLRAMDQYKDQFLSVISHELRTPLNFIMGFASLLEDEVPGPLNEQQQGAVSRILNGSDRMLKLVDDLLDIAKLQSDRFELAIEPTAYGPLVDEVAGLLRPLVDQRGLRLAADVAVPGTPAFDPARISQVLTNLLGNAIKFTDEGGTVAVRAYVDGDALVTQVMDTGVGIASDDIPKLFNRFQQLDMTNTRQAGGTGLGLAISKALVEAHGGTIGVESMPDAGSTFWFRLPLRGA